MKGLAVAVVLSAMSAWGQNRVASLQEQALCARQAQVVLKSAENYGYFPSSWDTFGAPTVMSNHFDPATNRCFVELEHGLADKYGRETERTVAIVNAFENRRVAYFDYYPELNDLAFCKVEDESCVGKGPLGPWSDPGYKYPADHFDALVKKNGMR